MELPSCLLTGLWLCLGAYALDIVQYGAFLKTATYSVASELGFFTAAGLDVVYNQVPSSTAAFSSLFDGDYLLLTATIDNALNYRFNLNQSVTVLGQLDQGPDLVLASIPTITNVSQLEGLPLMVDSPVSGYAYLLRYLLQIRGLELYDDYYFMTVGGTSTRYSNLLNGTLDNGTAAYGTLLAYPFTLEGQSLPEGEAPNILARISDYIAPITSSAFIIAESSLSNETESALLTRFLASMYAANMYLQDPENARSSIEAIATSLEIAIDVASQEYASVTNTVSGEVSLGGNFTVSPDGISNDVQVRNQFGGFDSVLTGINFTAALAPGSGNLIDYSIRDAAVNWYNNNFL